MTDELRKNRAPFNLTTPCKNCPFRTDVEAYLRPERYRSIAASLIDDDESFWCHQTLDYDREEVGGDVVGSRSRMCAGALSTLENEGMPNQAMRVAGRLGMYNPDNLDPGAPVYESIEAWVAAKTQSPSA